MSQENERQLRTTPLALAGRMGLEFLGLAQGRDGKNWRVGADHTSHLPINLHDWREKKDKPDFIILCRQLNAVLIYLHINGGLTDKELEAAVMNQQDFEIPEEIVLEIPASDRLKLIRAAQETLHLLPEPGMVL